jgi:hypothetical protein
MKLNFLTQAPEQLACRSKTVETVLSFSHGTTGLKPGVNENAYRYPPETNRRRK